MSRAQLIGKQEEETMQQFHCVSTQNQQKRHLKRLRSGGKNLIYIGVFSILAVIITAGAILAVYEAGRNMDE